MSVNKDPGIKIKLSRNFIILNRPIIFLSSQNFPIVENAGNRRQYPRLILHFILIVRSNDLKEVWLTSFVKRSQSRSSEAVQ